MSAYLNQKEYKEVISLYKNMHRYDIQSNPILENIALRACGKSGVFFFCFCKHQPSNQMKLTLFTLFF